MALRQMLGVACLAFHLLLAVPVVNGASPNTAAIHSVGLPYHNTTISRNTESSALSTRPVDNALSSTSWKSSSSFKILPTTDAASVRSLGPSTGISIALSTSVSPSARSGDHSSTLSSSSAYASSSRSSTGISSSAPYETKSSSIPSESSRLFPVPRSQSSQHSNATSSHAFASGQSSQTGSNLLLPLTRTGGSAQVPNPPRTAATKLGSMGSLSTGYRLNANGTYTSMSSQAQHSSRAIWNDRVKPTRTYPTGSLGTAIGNAGWYSSRVAIASGASGIFYSGSQPSGRNATVFGTTTASLGITAVSTFAAATSVTSTTSPNITSNAASAALNTSVVNSAFINVTVGSSTSKQLALSPDLYANSTSKNSTTATSITSNLTDTHSSPILPNLANSTFLHSASSQWASNTTSQENSTLKALLSNTSISHNETQAGLTLSEPALSNNTVIAFFNGSQRPVFEVGSAAPKNGSIAWLLSQGGSNGLSNSTFNPPSQCSGVVTVVPGVVTNIYTAIIEIYEATTMSSNATTPPPVYVMPPTACSTHTTHSYIPINPLQGANGGGPSISSVLLVTKKVPVVVRSPATVGPIFNVPTTTSQAVQVQSVADSSQPKDSSPEKVQGSEAEDQSAGSAPLQQVYALADSLPPSSAPSSNAPQADSAPKVASSAPEVAGAESNAAGSNSNAASSASNSASSGSPGSNSGSSVAGSDSPGSNYGSSVAGSGSPGSNSGSSVADSGSPGSNSGSSVAGSGSTGSNSGSSVAGSGFTGAKSGSSVIGTSFTSAGSGSEQAAAKDSQTTSEGSTAGNGGQTSSGGQSSNEDGQTGQSADQKDNGEGQASGVESTSRTGDQSASTGSQAAAGSSQSASGQTPSAQSSSEGVVTGSQVVGSGASGSSGSGGQSGTVNPAVVGEYSKTQDQNAGGNVGGMAADTDQNVPNAVTVGNVPISIDSAAVIIGSQTFNAGFPPTTVVANGQTITVDQSQIVAPGTTIPIEAAVASQPANSAIIGSVPVVLQPNNVVIGSQTFSHGSSAAFAVYNSQTYSWDAKQLVGPSGSMAAFPSATTVVPRITAGGQVFSVLSSTLKASETDIAIPNTPSASPFIYQNQTFSVNPSQLVAPDSSITVPPITTQPTPFVYRGETFSVDNSQLIAPSATLPLSSGSGTVRYGTTVITVDQSHVVCPDTTIALSSVPQAGNIATPSAVTTGGFRFSIGPAAAVIASSTYSFLPGQAPSTTTDQGQTVTLASSGVQFGNINVPIPTTPPSYSTITQGNLTFSVAPSAVVLNGQTNSVRSGVAPTTTTVNGQEISIGPQGVGIAGTTIALPMATNPSGFAVVTQGDLTVSVAPSAVVINGQTNSIGSEMTPIATNVNGQAISIGPQGVALGSTTIPLPRTTNSAGYAVITQGGLTFSVAPSAVVLSGQTNSIQPDMASITTTVNGQIVSIGPQGVGIANTTMSLPTPPPAYAVVSRGDLTFSVAPSEAVVKGSTFSIGPNMTATMVLNGQTVGVGPSEIDFPGTTVDLPSATSNQAPAIVTADGLTFAVGPTDAVLDGTTYAIGSGAVAKTIIFGSETIGLGTNGVVLPSTTVPPEQTPTAITADGLTFSADATEAIINGTAYAIGSAAIAKTVVYGSETIGLGTKGIVLPSTTIVPWGNATQTSSSSAYSASVAAAASSNSIASVSAAADSANGMATGLPGTSSGGTKGDVHHGTGHLLRPPEILVLGATLAALLLGLLIRL